MNIITVNLKTNGTLVYNNKPDKLILHHAAIKVASVEDINKMHLNEGFTMIGYNYYVRKDGTIYKGRPENAKGANCTDQNTSSISICVEGDYENSDTDMSTAQKNSVIELGRDILKRHPEIKKVDGHKAFRPTACPGKHYPLEEIKNAIMQPVTAGPKLTQLIVTGISACIDPETFNVLKYFQPKDAITAIGVKGNCWIVTINDKNYYVPAGYTKYKEGK